MRTKVRSVNLKSHSVHTDGRTWCRPTKSQSRSTRLVILIDSASDFDQDYRFFTGTETRPSTCYILFDV